MNDCFQSISSIHRHHNRNGIFQMNYPITYKLLLIFFNRPETGFELSYMTNDIRNYPDAQDNKRIVGAKRKGHLVKENMKNMHRTECVVAKLAINVKR